MPHHKDPQEWHHADDHVFTYFVRRTGEEIKIKASVEDLPVLSKLRWGIDGKGRAYTDWRTGKYESMHRVIMSPPDGLVVDHINCDHTDNRRSNLRICTHAQNLLNQKPAKSSAVGYKGVSFDKDGRKNPYRAKIALKTKQITIGSFETAKEAALAYDRVASKLHGEYAKTNRDLGLL